jgi:secretion/DNA translocation related CpaE-like protein
MNDEMRFVARLPGAGQRTLQLPALRAARARQETRERQQEPDRVPAREAQQEMDGTPEPADGPRTVAVEVPGMRAGSRPAELARCILLSRDVELAQTLASVAVGAGVQLLPCREVEQAAAYRDEVILVGQDVVGEIGSRLAASALILVGTEEHQDVLWRAAATTPGARVAVLPAAAAWLGEYLGQLGLHSGRARITLVAGAGGGAGASTFASLLAATATLEGSRTLLLDADPHSAGLWPILRPREPDGLGWEDLESSRGQLSPGQLAEILPLAQGTAVLSWVRNPGSFVPSEALLAEVLAASRRIYDHIVIDAGHVTGVSASVAALANTRLLLLPARSSNTAAGTGRRLADRLGERAGDWNLVLTGKLASGTDTRALAQRAGIGLGGYFAPSRAIARGAADGSLMNVLVRRSLRRTVVMLGRGPATEAGQAA